MKNIAIFYDIENLVGGHNLKYLSEISLKNIFDEFKRIGLTDIAIQKAYADWSNLKLQKLKWDIAELGIEPVQMYGFVKGGSKNASDIQLVIDAIEILHTKQFITTFIIVSGDGDFLSLAKKLGEYGKKVIGCSYKSTANSLFTKVCDEFVFIDKTLEKEQLIAIEKINIDENKMKYILSDPILKEVMPKFEPLNSYDLDTVIKKISELLDALMLNENARDRLEGNGFNISVFKSALNYLFSDFDQRKVGFTKLTDFLRFALKDTDFYLAFKEPSEYRIFKNGFSSVQFKKVEYLYEKPEIHTFKGYTQLLKTKMPIITIPDNICNFYKIVNYLLENRDNFVDRYYYDIIDELLFLDIKEPELHKILFLLINSNALKGDESSPIRKEQNYTLDVESIEEIKGRIYEAIKDKIESAIGKENLNQSILEEISKRF